MKSQSDATITNSDETSVLKERVAELENLLQELIAARKDVKTSELRADDYVEVVSLCPFPLTLSTETKGKGRLFKFNEFGQKKRILYSDLIRVIETHTTFLENGYFYILSPDVVRKHGLEDVYEKILTKDKIEKILEGENAVDIFNMAGDAQKKLISEMIIEKAKDEKLDWNLVESLSRASGIDIRKAAKDLTEAYKLFDMKLAK